jgi:hypothetical protein
VRWLVGPLADQVAEDDRPSKARLARPPPDKPTTREDDAAAYASRSTRMASAWRRRLTTALAGGHQHVADLLVSDATPGLWELDSFK